MFEHPELWWHDLMAPAQLAGYASRHGVRCNPDEIERLWELGWLRADVVTSAERVEIPGCAYTGTRSRAQGGKRYWYADCDRIPGSRERKMPANITLLFHRIQLLVLLKLFGGMERSARLWPGGSGVNLPANTWTPLGSEAYARWRMMVRLAIATLPCVYEQLFSAVTHGAFMDTEAFRRSVASHRKRLLRVYRGRDITDIESVINELCNEAAMRDSNRALHTVIRLSDRRFRDGIEGRLGAALQCDTVAECVRRFAEDAHKIMLVEEDERGFGAFLPGVKRLLYGGDRVRDGGSSARGFLRHHHLDYGTVVRWYAEGDTEVATLQEVFGSSPVVEVINLRGRVAQGGAVAFRDNLRLDQVAGIFSIVSVDGDHSQFAEAVRQAARVDEICGRFYIATGDFEVANFTLSELASIMLQSVEKATPARIAGLTRALRGAVSAKEVQRRARTFDPALLNVSKGAKWGRDLIAYALANHERDDGSGARPIIDAIADAGKLTVCNHTQTKLRYRLDPRTGELVPRAS